MSPMFNEYQQRFEAVDEYINHANSIVSQLQDEYLKHKYVGFIVTTAVTAYELAIKDIFIEFSYRKHYDFGVFIQNTYNQINGKIKLEHLKGNHLPSFGQKYKEAFNTFIDEKENEVLHLEHDSIQTCYGNVISWRHNFVHSNKCPPHATYDEAIKSYRLGKEVVHVLHDAFFK